MKKQLIISPVGLKGNEILERQKQLMGISSINEDRKNYAVELTKIGPDGNAYAVIRENHEWYIKKANKVKNLIAEDFKYIGGLQNKKQESYPSYAKAIKHLNLKFKSLAEAYNFDGEINVFENDNLLTETPMAAGFAEMKSNGFSGHGNLEEDMDMMEYDDKVMQSFIDQYGDKKGEEIYYATANKEKRNPETFKKTDEDIHMTEYEEAIDNMITKEELIGGQKNLDMNDNGELDADDFKQLRALKKKV
jgi:hypothetical protein